MEGWSETEFLSNSYSFYTEKSQNPVYEEKHMCIVLCMESGNLFKQMPYLLPLFHKQVQVL